MTAAVTPIAAGRFARARRLARERGEFIRELAEELAAGADTAEGRAFLAGFYEARGWATHRDLTLALEALGEGR
mgnify:CR=1 FL=1